MWLSYCGPTAPPLLCLPLRTSTNRSVSQEPSRLHDQWTWRHCGPRRWRFDEPRFVQGDVSRCLQRQTDGHRSIHGGGWHGNAQIVLKLGHDVAGDITKDIDRGESGDVPDLRRPCWSKTITARGSSLAADHPSRWMYVATSVGRALSARDTEQSSVARVAEKTSSRHRHEQREYTHTL